MAKKPDFLNRIPILEKRIELGVKKKDFKSALLQLNKITKKSGYCFFV